MKAELGIWPVRVESEQLGEALAERLGGELIRPWRGAEPQKAQFQEQFAQRSQWVLVMATGIATRFVDGLLRDKHEDPAVVVLDEAGRYAVALVGGPEGGANALAYRVANAVGAIPVVTTATEANKFLVVGIGCRKGVSEEQIERAVLRALAQCGAGHRRRAAGGRHVADGSEATVGREVAGEGDAASGRHAAGEGDAASGRHAAGEGDAASGRDAAGRGDALAGAAILAAVREVATVDLKAEEPGLVAFCQRHGIPLRVIAKHQIEARPWVSQPSEWVRQSVGLDGVCEPCALISSMRGRLVVPKTTLDGVAVAIVADEWGFGS
jgi:cobalt-precorrin 5A hydrolase